MTTGESAPRSFDRLFWGAVAVCTLVGFAARLWWVTSVEPPGGTVYSDMLGYILRGRDTLSGKPPPVPSCYPFGADWFYAAEMWWFGTTKAAYPSMAVFQAVWGATAVPLIMLISRRTVSHLAGSVLAGLFVALWHPVVAMHGYFLSEVPFIPLLLASHWLWLRFVQTGRGGPIASIVSGVAFTIRPQVLLFVALVSVWGAFRHPEHGRRWLRALMPLALILAFTSGRMYSQTGRWGMISANDKVGRFFADTDHKRMGSFKPGTPKAKQLDKTNWFHPPARTRVNGWEGSGF